MRTTCPICSSEAVLKALDFTPYSDKEWTFEVFDCQNCDTRWAARDPEKNYHEELHQGDDNSYRTHYQIAERVKQDLDQGRIDEARAYLSGQSFMHESILKQVDRLPPGSHVLEVGSSSGYMTAMVHALGHICTGVDVSQKAIQRSTALFGEYFTNAAPSEDYDLIFHKGVISCVDDPRSFLVQYANKLRTGGTMFFNASNVSGIRCTSDIWLNTPPPDVIFLFGPQAFDHLAPRTCAIEISHGSNSWNTYRKNKAIRSGKPHFKYPRRYTGNAPNAASSSITQRIIHGILPTFVNLATSIGIIKPFADDFGTLVTLTKR